MSMYQVRRPTRSVHVPVRDVHYHVQQWSDGEARPPLLLLHGWMDVAASWQFLVDALDADFVAGRTVLAPDWRGFGWSRGPACDHYAFADYLGDLDALLDHFCGDRSVDLVGHSMGGNVAMMYAGVRPERVRRLVNLEGFGMPATRPGQAPARYRRWLDEIKALRGGDKALRSHDDVDSVAARLMKTNPRLPRDQAEWLARQWAEPRPATGGNAAHRVVSAQLFRVEEMLALYAAISAPVLMVEASDNAMADWWRGSYSLAEFHQRLQHVARVERLTLPDCGHMLHHDQPLLLARHVQAFLQA